MSKHYETMAYAIGMASERIVHALKQYVMAVGEEFSEYHRNEFGIDEEETEENVKVLKVLNIFDNGGCYFPWTNQFQVDDDCGYTSCAFHCLYVVEEDGVQKLKYYMLYNDGPEYDADVSEPDHGYAISLSLQELDKLISFIQDFDKYIK